MKLSIRLRQSKSRHKQPSSFRRYEDYNCRGLSFLLRRNFTHGHKCKRSKLRKVEPPIQIPYPVPVTDAQDLHQVEVEGIAIKLEISPEELQTSNNPLDCADVKVETRPILRRAPPIWSVSRQEVCESFDWFRSYQGGVYSSKEVVKGYLLGGFSSKRDGFFNGGKLIISHGGGKSEAISNSKGQFKLVEPGDQLAEDKSVRALVKNFKHQIPVVLLIDHKYSLFPYNLKGTCISYAVLGLYYISHVWAEREIVGAKTVVRYKFAFQWADQEDPWWWCNDRSVETAMETGLPELVYPAPQDISRFRNPPVKLRTQLLSQLMPPRDPELYLKCPRCNEQSPQVFSIGWACLNPSCHGFWSCNGVFLPEDELDYNPSFLTSLPSHPILREEYRDIRPPLPITAPPDGVTTIRSFTRGFHCRECGKLSCRYKWQQWECSNCKNTLVVSGRPRLADELRNTTVAIKHSLNPSSGIARLEPKTFKDDVSSGQIETYLLPHGNCRIYHLTTKPDGLALANEIFKEYQEQATSGELIFRRWPLRSCRENSLPITFLTTVRALFRPEPRLSYSNLDCSRRRTISSMWVIYARKSLLIFPKYVGGAANTVPWDRAPSAVVKARELIRKRTVQAKRGEFEEFNEILSAAYMEDQKMSFHTDDEPGLGPTVAGLSLGSPAVMHFRRRGRGISGRNEIALTVILRHGDVLIMDGDDLQKNYEHAVIPVDFRIAATARSINPDR
ncbi:hypothetical protein PM082_001610 [Marasmius tenuissimus]|nr:hypothetical protein PM082_001610 [Marasmius tenuissimus]